MGLTLQAIFQQGYAAYEQAHPLPAHQRKAARAILQCRTAALGAISNPVPTVTSPASGTIPVGIAPVRNAPSSRPNGGWRCNALGCSPVITTM